MTYKGFQIRKSGKRLFKVMENGKQKIFHRFSSVEGAVCGINASIEKRPYTKEEHRIVYGEY